MLKGESATIFLKPHKELIASSPILTFQLLNIKMKLNNGGISFQNKREKHA